VWTGVGSVWEQEKLEARKMLVNRARDTPWHAFGVTPPFGASTGAARDFELPSNSWQIRQVCAALRFVTPSVRTHLPWRPSARGCVAVQVSAHK